MGKKHKEQDSADSAQLPLTSLAAEQTNTLAAQPCTPLCTPMAPVLPAELVTAIQPTLVYGTVGTETAPYLAQRIQYLVDDALDPHALLVLCPDHSAIHRLHHYLQGSDAGRVLPRIALVAEVALDIWQQANADTPTVLGTEHAQELFFAVTTADTQTQQTAWRELCRTRQYGQPAPQEWHALYAQYHQYKNAWNIVESIDLLQFWQDYLQTTRSHSPWEQILLYQAEQLSEQDLHLIHALLPPSGEGLFVTANAPAPIPVTVADYEFVPTLRLLWPHLHVHVAQHPRPTAIKMQLADAALEHVQYSTIMAANKENSSLLTQEESTDYDQATTQEQLQQSSATDPLQLSLAQAAQDIQVTILNSAQKNLGTRRQSCDHHSAPKTLQEKSQEHPQPDRQEQGTNKQDTVRQEQGTSKQGTLHLFTAPTAESEVQWLAEQLERLLVPLPLRSSLTESKTPHWAKELKSGSYAPKDVAILVRHTQLAESLYTALHAGLKNRLTFCTAARAAFWQDTQVRYILRMAGDLLGMSQVADAISLPACPAKVIARGPLAMGAYLADAHPFSLGFWHSQAFVSCARAFEREGGWAGLFTYIALHTPAYMAWQQADAVPILTYEEAEPYTFALVFLPGLEDGFVPHTGAALLTGKLTRKLATDIRKERALFQTALRSAAEGALLSYAQKRTQFGGLRLQPSRFITELPQDVLTTSSVLLQTRHEEQQLSLLS